MIGKVAVAIASLFLISCMPAHADRENLGWRGHDNRGWNHAQDLRRACRHGNDRACHRLGDFAWNKRDHDHDRGRDWRHRHDRDRRDRWDGKYGGRDWRDDRRWRG